MNALIRMLAAGFGAGYMPVASGTWGSAVGLAAAWFLFGDPLRDAVLTLALCVFSVPVATRAERLFGRTDDGRIVIDEIAGMWVALLWLPHTVGYFCAAFLLFRVFDVLKPLGIRRVQDLHGGWGIVLDDLLAGLLANLVLQAVAALL